MISRLQALEILGYRCTTQGVPPEIVEWHDERPQPENWEVIIAEAEALAPSAKQWPDSAAFLSEFTLSERGAIWNTDDTIIGGLALLLTAWKGVVLATDPNIQAGMTRLVGLSILTAERAAAILGETQPS
jgi:hypothetical protein